MKKQHALTPAKKNPGDIDLGGGIVHATGIDFHGGCTEQQFEAIAMFCARVDSARQWWIGDLVNFGENRYGDKYHQYTRHFKIKYDTVRHMARVADVFEIGRRRPNLPWSFHESVAALPIEQQEQLLDEAEPLEGGENPRLTQKELRQKVRDWKAEVSAAEEEAQLEEAKASVPAPPLPVPQKKAPPVSAKPIPDDALKQLFRETRSTVGKAIRTTGNLKEAKQSKYYRDCMKAADVWLEALDKWEEEPRGTSWSAR